MNITDLKSFLIVAEYRSFEFAAKRMHVTTSTISKRIKKIESELNKSLFITRGNMLILSSEGQYCLPYIRKILDLYKSILNRDEYKTPINLGTILYVNNYYLPSFIHYITENNANIFVNIQIINENFLTKKLKDKWIDFAICPTQSLLPQSISSGYLWSEYLVAAVSKNHPLAQKNKSLSLKSLVKFDGVILKKGGVIPNIIESVFKMNKVIPHSLIETTTLDTCKKLVLDMNLWSIIPKKLCDDEIVQLSLTDARFKIEFSWYCLKSSKEEEPIFEKLICDLTKWSNFSD